MKGILVFALLSTTALASENREEMVEGCRRKIMGMARVNAVKIFSPIERNDLAEELIDGPAKMIKRPLEMETRLLLSGQSKNIPWSDSYWPIYRGGLGQRYNDPDFMAYDWGQSHEYIMAKPAADFVRDGKIEILSPAEKYDFLLGLTTFPLTASNWTEGQEYFTRSGRVESWMGYCHGWAPSSMMMPEPKKKITVGKIPFFPSDIKGLSTLTWARGEFPTRFIGGRCNSQTPDTDRDGRATDQSCLDNNPGTWHLVVVNQLGISKRPFIMDASYDYQVWNHPVYSYEYHYFHPKTHVAGNYAASVEKAGNWDSRKNVRSPETKFLVGVQMTVTYAVENEPSTLEDQASESSTASYEYDLELNGKGEIIGGEWHTHGHPDFLWVPEPGVYPRTGGENLSVNLASLSREVREAALASAKRGLPAGNVVKELVKASLTDH